MARQRRLNPAARYINKDLAEIMRHTYDYPVTFIGAPPGYGKTVLVDSLPDDGDTYRIDVFFNEESILFKKIDEIMRWHWPDIIRDIPKMGDISIDEVLEKRQQICLMSGDAMRRIRNSEKRLRIIIEDLNFVSGADDIAVMLCDIASHSDGKIHFVITSRVNFWRRFSIDVVTGKVLLVLPKMLLLDEDGIIQYFRLCGINIDDRTAAALYRDTGGWMLSLYLEMIEYIRNGCYKSQSDISEYISELRKTITDIETETEFAVDICHMDSFTVNQAERFTGRSDAEEIIQSMCRRNMYINYDPTCASYSFIAPFKNYVRDIFRQERSENEQALLKKAGDIMAEDEIFVKAADYYHRAGEYELMMSVIERGGHTGSNEEKRENYIRYYRDCPRDIRSRYHLAMLYMAWRFFNYGEYELYKEASLEFLEDLYSDQRLHEKEKNSLLCDYSTFRAMTDFEDIEKVKQDYENAMAVFDGVKRNYHSVIPRTFGSTSVLKLFYNKGKLDDTLNMIDEISELGMKLIGGGWAGITCEAKAEAAFMRLDFDTAEVMIDRAERKCAAYPEHSAGVSLCIAFLKSRIALMRGVYRRTKDPMEEFIEREKGIMMTPLKKTAEVCQAWMNIQVGDIDNVNNWIKTGDFSDVELLYPAMPSIYIIHMCVLFSRKKYTRLLSYEDLFFGKDPLTNNFVIKEVAYMLAAAAWNEIGKTYNARDRLQKAFDLAKETENYATIVMYGDTLVPLMKQLPEQYSAMTSMLIPVVERFVMNRERCRLAIQDSGFRGLTKRETQVAACAAEGMRNREIAQELQISENTVKTTLQRVFSKLDITSRRQLPEKLREW